MIKIAAIIISGFAGGLAVGASIVAFLTVLGIVVRVIEWTGAKEHIRWYQISIVLGSLVSCLIYFFDINLIAFKLLAVPIGLLMGIFVGMIAAALTETLDIISTAVNKLGIVKWLYVIVFVVILGKVAGSILFFILPGFF